LFIRISSGYATGTHLDLARDMDVDTVIHGWIITAIIIH
jgi:hypothetical protein